MNEKNSAEIKGLPKHIEPNVGSDEYYTTAENPADDYTDAGLARLFAIHHRSRVRFCPALGWLVYNGIVWERSKHSALWLLDSLTTKMVSRAKAQYKQASAELAQAEIDDNQPETQTTKARQKKAKEFLDYTRKCRSTSKMKSVLNHAECHLEIKQEELDKDPYLLNTPKGTFDLKTGEIKPHNPNDFCTKVTTISPADNSDNERLNDFLSLIFCGDMELLHFVKVAVGSALIGKVYVEALLVAYGDGCNGKSTFFNTIGTVLGSYSSKMPATSLTSKGTNIKHDLAELLGVRFCVAAETEEGMRLSTSMLKQIASTDRISAERKFYDPFNFCPSHLVILFTNHLPKVSSLDAGTWRRLKVIPFDAAIKNTDTSFAEKLLEESGGALLRWLIEGAQEFIANMNMFPSCEAVRLAGNRYKESNDWLKSFLDECVEQGSGEFSAGELYARYYRWAATTNNYPRSKADFKAAMESAGFAHRKTNAGARWSGILNVLPSCF